MAFTCSARVTSPVSVIACPPPLLISATVSRAVSAAKSATATRAPALAHKGLAVETVPWRFIEKDKLPSPNQGRVPVIRDGGRVVHDSTAIADYLEEHYPDRPSLFGGEVGRGLTRFVQNWTETVLHIGLIRLVLLDIHRHLDPENQAYFRQDREKRFGM